MWCVRVPTGAFVARRHGQVFITGNSGFPKATRVKDAPAFEGHRYGLQATKPSLEPIIVAQKPYDGKPVDSITRTGAGAFWIDGGRVNSVVFDSERRTSVPAPGIWGQGKKHPQQDGEQRHNSKGRWPPNLVLVHNPECVRVGERRVRGSTGVRGASTRIYGGGKGFTAATGEEVGYADADGLETVAAYECHESCPVRRLGEQSGVSKTPNKITRPRHRRHDPTNWRRKTGDAGLEEVALPGDTGTAARFYPNPDWSYEIAERSACCECGYIEPNGNTQLDCGHYMCDECLLQGAALDHDCPSMEVGRKLAAADPVRYQSKAARKERDAGLGVEFPLADPPGSKRSTPAEGRQNALGAPRRCSHPTVKPIALTRWLATLLLPPPEYAPRRLLVPFAGVGSEMIGACQAGWDYVLGIEMGEEYCDIARARLAWWVEVW